jgi:hypothetical protein
MEPGQPPLWRRLRLPGWVLALAAGYCAVAVWQQLWWQLAAMLCLLLSWALTLDSMRRRDQEYEAERRRRREG